jgi:two-component system sensor histidine kinase MprB
MTLRARLALLAAAAVAIAVVVVSLVAYRASRDQQRDAFDDALRAQATATAGRAAALVDLSSRFPQRADPFAAEDLVFQVVDPRGDTQHPVGQPGLPVSEAELAVAREAEPEALRDVEVEGQTYRMITVPLNDRPAFPRGRFDGAVQLARSLEPVDASLAGLRSTLLVVTALGVAAAAGAGLLVARRALRPVEELTSTAEHVAATQELTSRIEVDRRDELGRLAESFNAMLAALATSREQQQRLVSDASHELRTPLTSLRTNVELLQRSDGMPEQERRQIVDDAVHELEELSALVAELVELATDAQRSADAWEDVQLDDVVAAAADRARRRTRLTIDVEAEPTTVRGSPHLLERAVANILDNAGKWSPPDGRVVVTLRQGRLTVHDDGPGIREADLAHVWDRFRRGEGTQAVPGSGLGLAIVREVVEAHGGRVFAANREEGGTAVGFTLPVAF